MGTIHIIPPEGEITREDATEAPPLERLRELVGGWVEQVSVLYNDKHAFMFVNEEGAIAVGGRGPLPLNPRASEIYWEWPLRRGALDPFNAPWIHGVAVLLENIRVE